MSVKRTPKTTISTIKLFFLPLNKDPTVLKAKLSPTIESSLDGNYEERRPTHNITVPTIIKTPAATSNLLASKW